MLKKICLGAALSWTGIILYLCLIKASNLPSVDIVYLDKFVHAFFHFVFSLLWFLVLRFYYKNQSSTKLLGIVFFISLSFGITIELFQAFFTVSRNGDVIDVLSNTTGALLAILVLTFLNKNNFLNKIPK
ncbi:VanZ family protein [Flavobacterium sufflavum]|uniref:VanZ family protein n=1 Tax=Flavobacterium sufflavum TaxID=1921138 RepID=UPI0013E8C5A6|nr:VanZ family protein [Flavobacterium sufflavum]